jgi:DNA (cytosine-5)-methyltransferase 1
MKFIELFAGIGAFRLGLENTGHECVWSNEWLPKPRRIYEANFGEEPDPRDIRLIKAEDIPTADIICGGFPCATFSIAGKRTGFSLEDTRGTLAFEMFRIARDKKIPYILFENVKGLLNHDKGRTFGIILSVLDEMGYDTQWEVLDSQNFGLPQHRERIFVVANLRNKPRPKVFPIGTEGGDYAFETQKKRKINKSLDMTNEMIEVLQWRRGYFRLFKSDGVPTLTANMGTGGNNVPYVSAVLTPFKDKKRQRGRRMKHHNEPSFALTAQDRHGVAIYNSNKVSIRKLTPLECERLQGFPDNFTKFYSDGSLVSDAERYERCGRTISIPVVEAIGKKLHEFY